MEKMSALEFENAMKELGLSSWAMARAICRTPVTVYKFRKGLSEIGESTATYIRMMIELVRIDPKNKSLPDEVRK